MPLLSSHLPSAHASIEFCVEGQDWRIKDKYRRLCVHHWLCRASMASMRAAAAHVQEVLREVPAGAKTSPGCLQAQGKHLMETPNGNT